ncbi:MAG: LysM peptidoglycan-binding domain-containing protein [Paludibacteraceae bacterium]|nr:LysM peptidoglycan-binding domain-containing protein [Paludibacteraceae bacterium]
MKKTILFIALLTVAYSVFAQTDSLMPYPIDTVKHTAVYRYQVEKSIGLYRISKNFGVTQEEIIKWNPQLNERGLHVDEIILIPVRVSEGAASKPVESATQKPTLPLATMTRDKQQISNDIQLKAETQHAVAMPLHSDKSDTLDLVFMLPLQANAVKRDPNMDRFYDFYAGSLLAIRKVQSPNLHIRVHTYDIGKTEIGIQEILAKPALKQADMIIGPVYNPQIALVAEFAKENKIMTLLPFSSSVPDLESNPYLIQFNSTSDLEATQMANYLSGASHHVNCILIDAKDEDIPTSVKQLRNAIINQGIPYTTTSIHAIMRDSLSGILNEGAENVFIFNTERYTNLQTVMPHLLKTIGRYNVTLLSRYSWQKEKILLPQVYGSIFHTDSTSAAISYQSDFDLYFGHIPASDQPRYDMLGYDLTHHVLDILHRMTQASTEEEKTEIIESTYHGLQSDIQFRRQNENGGYLNHKIKIVSTSKQ